MKTLIIMSFLMVSFADAVTVIPKSSGWDQVGYRMGEDVADRIRRDQDWRNELRRQDLQEKDMRFRQEMLRFQRRY